MGAPKTPYVLTQARLDAIRQNQAKSTEARAQLKAYRDDRENAIAAAVAEERARLAALEADLVQKKQRLDAALGAVSK